MMIIYKNGESGIAEIMKGVRNNWKNNQTIHGDFNIMINGSFNK